MSVAEVVVAIIAVFGLISLIVEAIDIGLTAIAVVAVFQPVVEGHL